MAWYRATGSLHTFISKAVSKCCAPQQLISRTNLLNNSISSFISTSSTKVTKTRANLGAPSALRLAGVGNENHLLKPSHQGSTRVTVTCNLFHSKKRNIYTPWRSSVRCYYSESNQVVGKFKRKAWYVRYIAYPVFALVILLLGSGSSVYLILGYFETIPYTKRKHLLIMSKASEIDFSEKEFEDVKREYNFGMLPVQHPDTIRICSIAKSIFLAVERGLKNDDEALTDLGYDDHLSKQIKIWIDQTRKKLGREKGGRSQNDNEWVRWDVMLLNAPSIVYVRCLAGGKILISTGLLDHFKTDAELATLIAHEVAHALARHFMENLTINFWLIIGELLFSSTKPPKRIIEITRPYSKRMELEADYIGLLLMASAGYDPREAPLTYQKMWESSDNKAFKSYNSAHPSSEKRATMLNKAKVMQEAVYIYRELIAGRVVKGFLL